MINGELLKWLVRCIIGGAFAWGGWMTNTTLNNKTEIAIMRQGIAHIVETTGRIDVKLDRMDRRRN